jgi:hypothetical protein
MDNDILYSDAQEQHIIRVRDVIPVIEARAGMRLIDIHYSKRREDVNSSWNTAQFPDQKPLAIWWFLVAYDSPEGKREGMVKTVLDKDGLRVHSFDRPTLLFYNEATRKKAKDDAPELTREYIEQLEEALQSAHFLWKTANENARTESGLRDGVYDFHVEFRKLGYLLADNEDGGPQGLGLRKLYLPDRKAKYPDQYITGDEELL